MGKSRKVYPKKRWTYKIVNAKNIPKDYWILDTAALSRDVDKGVRYITGLKIYETEDKVSEEDSDV